MTDEETVRCTSCNEPVYLEDGDAYRSELCNKCYKKTLR